MIEKYVTPTLSVTVTIMENGILAGSSNVIIGDPNGIIKEEWNLDRDTIIIDW